MRLRPQFRQTPTGEGGIIGLERAFDLLAPELQKGEIRAVIVSVKTLGNLGKTLGVAHNASQFYRVTKAGYKLEKLSF